MNPPTVRGFVYPSIESHLSPPAQSLYRYVAEDSIHLLLPPWFRWYPDHLWGCRGKVDNFCNCPPLSSGWSTLLSVPGSWRRRIGGISRQNTGRPAGGPPGARKPGRRKIRRDRGGTRLLGHHRRGHHPGLLLNLVVAQELSSQFLPAADIFRLPLGSDGRAIKYLEELLLLYPFQV
jgi:hypothetical protein